MKAGIHPEYQKVLQSDGRVAGFKRRFGSLASGKKS